MITDNDAVRRMDNCHSPEVQHPKILILLRSSTRRLQNTYADLKNKYCVLAILDVQTQSTGIYYRNILHLHTGLAKLSRLFVADDVHTG